MNEEYLNELAEEYKDQFMEQGLDICNGKDLKEEIIYIVENALNIEFDSARLFGNEELRNIIAIQQDHIKSLNSCLELQVKLREKEVNNE